MHRHHNEGAGEFQVVVSCQRETGAGVISLRRRNSRKLEEKAVEDSRRGSNGAAGSTNKVQMVKTCHKRISNIKQTSSQRT